MRDARVAKLAGRQFNRISRTQLLELGLSSMAIEHRVATRRLVIVESGVFAVAPVLEHDPWGKWMGATLTAPGTRLARRSAGAAFGFWTRPRPYEEVVRAGTGGPRRHGGLLVYRSATLEGECEHLHGIPITSAPRTLLDLTNDTSPRALARAVREAVRLEATTVGALVDYVGRHTNRRGARKLSTCLARYTGLPLERARSGAEVRAMEVLRDAGCPLPTLNVRIAGEEADLSWRRERLIIEIDGGPFHLDVGEDARKEAAWEGAGWTVQRLPSDAVYDDPGRLVRLAPAANVQNDPL